MSAVLPVSVGFTRPTTVKSVPLIGMVEPSFSDLVLAYATFTRISFGASLAIHRPVVSWSVVTRPTLGVAGSTPAATYGWLLMSVDGGFTTCWTVWRGVVNCALNSLKR